MAAKRKRIPRYSKVQVNGHEYYKTDNQTENAQRAGSVPRPLRFPESHL